MIVALLLFGLSAVYADRCASVPPSLWCSSEKLGKECGFEEICNRTCMTSPIGDELQLEAAEKTANIWPEKHRWVPWIVVNGVSLESVQSLMYNLPHHLCEWYNGDQEIPFCASDGKAELPGIFGENIINQLTNRE
ncbi:hypothetical protein KIN20_033527 [Parelaphostrongylus tenuis]|uniref:Uncharacterized protein n=1 Tax=Parelaphostrongylus tenuis TaxID=148309 RepID=A0AAD5WJA5_PARTN|nr:hypothetical protein KIN20_033527 [Parelaphostrongylus tenuis]